MSRYYTVSNSLRTFAATEFPTLCQSRREDSHKGTFGTVAVIGGNKGMMGATVLAGQSALLGGAGKVRLYPLCGKQNFSWIGERPELMLGSYKGLPENAQDASCLVVGCGMGNGKRALGCLKSIQALSHIPAVFDADALNLAARGDAPFIAKRQAATVLTPHPAEAARLLHTDTTHIQTKRADAATRLAQLWQAYVVLKGHHSIIATPEGTLFVNTSGNAALATAGSGDVLAGLIGSLIAQKIPVLEAVRAGVWLHGMAGDLSVENGISIGLCAAELPEIIRYIRHQIIRPSNAECVPAAMLLPQA